MKKIRVSLSTRDLTRAIKEVNDYRKSIIEKTNELAQRLLEDGVQVANAYLGSTVGDSTEGTIGFQVDQNGDITKAVIYLGGKDALFIEFGAGIVYNTGAEHPYAAQLGYGPGTYPSLHPPNRGINPGYWYYREDGVLIRSIGTGASMPMYHAAENARNETIKKAMEIFRS